MSAALHSVVPGFPLHPSRILIMPLSYNSVLDGQTRLLRTSRERTPLEPGLLGLDFV